MKRILTLIIIAVSFSAMAQNYDIKSDTVTFGMSKTLRGKFQMYLSSVGQGIFNVTKAGKGFTFIDSVIMDKVGSNKVMGTNSAGTTVGLTTVQLSTLGLATLSGTESLTNKTLDGTNTLPFWKTITGTYASDSTFTFTFTGSYLDVQKYNRSLFTCRGEVVAGTKATATTDYIRVTAHGKRIGDIVWFEGVPPSPLSVNRGYFVQAIKTDSIAVSEIPSGSVLDLTTVGGVDGFTVSFSIVGYVKILTISGTTVTATVYVDTVLTNTCSSFKFSQFKKVDDYIHTCRPFGGEATADAANSQGAYWNSFKKDCYLLGSDFSVGTAAVGAGAACAYNVYNNTSYMYATAPDLATNSYFGTTKIPHKIKFIAQNSSVTVRITAVGGATNKAARGQVDMTIVPVYDFVKP